MAQAPSEKHLEDYLWNHPEALGYLDAETDILNFAFKWRQVQLPAGVADLMGISSGLSISIVELKRGHINSKSFAQIMRYVRDLKLLMDDVLQCYELQGLPYLEQLPRHPNVDGTWDQLLISGTLIGHGCSDRNLLAACEACGISVFYYDYSNGVYTFERDTSEIVKYGQHRRALESGSLNEIRFEMVKRLRFWLETDYESEVGSHNRSFSAVEAAENYLNMGGDA